MCRPGRRGKGAVERLVGGEVAEGEIGEDSIPAYREDNREIRA
jgi:hypothetical protein